MRLARTLALGWALHFEQESRNPFVVGTVHAAAGLFLVRRFELEARRGASLELA
ncbi:MAG: hypothetical protein ACXWZP_07470 [Gaiellaceae bacterium]